MDHQEHLPIELLREPKVKLRNVDRESVEFLEMHDSIRDHGILQPLLVRPVDDHYEIIEGYHRYLNAKDLGLKTVPCLIRQCSDDEALVLQIAANAISPETKLAEYALHLKRLMKHQDLTIRELACLVRKEPTWIGKCLNLTRLVKAIQVMVDRGEIPANNAYMLAKIPRSMQHDYVDRAKVMKNKDFKVLAAACVKQFTEAVKQGKMDAFYADKFKAQAHLRNLKEVESELAHRQVGALLCTAEDCKGPLDGFYLGLEWVCHLDKASVKEQEAIIRSRR